MSAKIDTLCAEKVSVGQSFNKAVDASLIDEYPVSLQILMWPSGVTSFDVIILFAPCLPASQLADIVIFNQKYFYET